MAQLKLTIITFLINVLDDTIFIEERSTSLISSGRQIKHVRKEGYCKTHCAANSSCDVYSYNTDTSSCYLSSEAKVVMSDWTEKPVSVKMSFKKKLEIEYDNGCQTISWSDCLLEILIIVRISEGIMEVLPEYLLS